MKSYDKNVSPMEIVEDLLIETGEETKPGVFKIQDCKHTLTVDGVNGVISYSDNLGNPKFYYGCESKHQKGYVYCSVHYPDKQGVVRQKVLGQHQIVALTNHYLEYLKLKNAGIAPVACHVNGVPWDNKSDNLEWGSQKQNVRQAWVCRSMDAFFPEGTLTVRESRKGKQVVKVIRGLRNSWIEEFLENEGPTALRPHKNYLCNKEEIHKLVLFLKQKQYWNL